MDDIIREVEEPFTFRVVVDFRKLNDRVIPDPYPIPPAKKLNRIAHKKICKTSVDLKYGFGAMGFYGDHSKFMAVTWGSREGLYLHRVHPDCFL